jgi:hypothetical protein
MRQWTARGCVMEDTPVQTGGGWAGVPGKENPAIAGYRGGVFG